MMVFRTSALHPRGMTLNGPVVGRSLRRTIGRRNDKAKARTQPTTCRGRPRKALRQVGRQPAKPPGCVHGAWGSLYVPYTRDRRAG